MKYSCEKFKVLLYTNRSKHILYILERNSQNLDKNLPKVSFIGTKFFPPLSFGAFNLNFINYARIRDVYTSTATATILTHVTSNIIHLI